MGAFFSKIELPFKTEHQRFALNCPSSREEVLIAIRSLQTGKAPGPDGLSSEVLRYFG